MSSEECVIKCICMYSMCSGVYLRENGWIRLCMCMYINLLISHLYLFLIHVI